MKIVTFGCSWTFGHGLSNQNTNPSIWPKNPQDIEYAKNNSWPAWLARDFCVSLDNLSMPGGSNDRIARSAIQYFTQNKNKENYIAIIVWTAFERRELGILSQFYFNIFNSKLDSYLNINLEDFYDTDITLCDDDVLTLKKLIVYHSFDEIHCFVNYLLNVINLTNYFKVNNINFLMLNGINSPYNLKTIIDQKYKNDLKFVNGTQTEIFLGNKLTTYAKEQVDCLFNDIDLNNFVIFENSYDEVLIRLLKNKKDVFDITNHPTLNGHQIIADFLKNELIQRRLI